MTRPRLTLCMIARDEAELLPDCLRSVQGVVDRIVLVDTGSTDATVEIARAAGARVIEHAWRDDFAEARNAGLAAIRGGFVLVLDADERLAPGAKRVLRRAMRAGGFDLGWLPLHDASRLDATRADVVSGRARHGEPQWLPRLLRWSPDLAYAGCVHETVSAWAEGKRERQVPASIVHLGAVPELREARGKNERNTRLLRLRAEREPDEPVVRAHLARELERAGDPAGALAESTLGWEAVVRRRAAGDARVDALLAGTVHAQLLLDAGRPADAARVLDDARRFCGTHPNVVFLSGVCAEQASLSTTSREALLREARALYSACLEENADARVGELLPGATSWQARLRRATVCLRQGDAAAAAIDFRQVSEVRAEDREARLGLAECELESGAAAAALARLEPAVAEGLTDAWALAAECAAALGASEDAAIFAGRVAEAAEQQGWTAPHRRVRFESWEASRRSAASGVPVRRNVLVWPRYGDRGELDAVLQEFGKTLAACGDAQLFVVHDAEEDGDAGVAVEALERAYARCMPEDATLEVVFWTDPMTESFERALADEVVCTLALPSALDGKRASFFARIGAPSVSDAAELERWVPRGS